MNKYFIPTVIEINGVKVPSTPYVDKNSTTILLGDVIEIEFDDEGLKSKEVNLVEFINGCYYATCKNVDKNTPLYMHFEHPVTRLGNSHDNPQLLELLTN